MTTFEKDLVDNDVIETTQALNSPTPGEAIIDTIDENTEQKVRQMELAKCNWYELTFTVFTGFVFIGLHYVPGKIKNALYIAGIGLVFGFYIIYKMKYFGMKIIQIEWGLRTNNFKISFLWCSIVAFIGLLFMIVYMLIFNTGLPFHYDLILMFILYPIWGCIQQFLIQSMIAINLYKLQINYYLIIFLTAIAFTLVHFPEFLLMFVTFCVGLTFTPIFLKYKCLYPLGLYHGWCGALFYWLVLDQDPMKNF